MFIVLLKFGNNKGRAGEFMEGHNLWLKKGFAEGVFLLAGSLKTMGGGAVLTRGMTLEDVNEIVQAAPFVREAVVEAEIIEIEPKKTSESLQFVLEDH